MDITEKGVPGGALSEGSRLVVRDADDSGTKSGTWGTILIFVNTVVGAGIIVAPYSLRLSGFGCGVLSFVLVACLTDYALIMMIRGSTLSGTDSYIAIMRAAFHTPGYIITVLMQLIHTLITMIVFNIIVADGLTKIMMRLGADKLPSILLDRRMILVIFTLVITLPLSLYKHLSRLEKWGSLGVLSVLTMAILMVVKLAQLHIPGTHDAFNVIDRGLISGIVITALSMTAPHSVHTIYNGMADRTEVSWRRVVHYSIMIVSCIIIFVALIGYATFTGNVRGNVLQNYCTADDVINAARLLFTVNILMTFPIQAFVVREILDTTLFPHTYPGTWVRHIFLTVCIVLLALALSLPTDCLGIVVEMNGLLTTSPMSFIMPPLAVMKLQDDKLFSCKNIPLILMILFGSLVSVVGIVMGLYNLHTNNICLGEQEPQYCLETFEQGAPLTVNISQMIADMQGGAIINDTFTWLPT